MLDEIHTNALAFTLTATTWHGFTHPLATRNTFTTHYRGRRRRALKGKHGIAFSPRHPRRTSNYAAYLISNRAAHGPQPQQGTKIRIAALAPPRQHT